MNEMTLTKQDLEQIRGVVQDEVGRGVEPFFAAIQRDIQRLDGRIDGVRTDIAIVRVELNELQPVRQELAELRDDVRGLITSLDGYAKKTEDWHQEYAILKARHDKLHHVLVQKGVVSDDELILGS